MVRSKHWQRVSDLRALNSRPRPSPPGSAWGMNIIRKALEESEA